MADIAPEIPHEVKQCMGKRFKVSGYNDLRCNGVKWNDVIQGWSLVFNPKKKIELFLPFD